jgi:tetratricopeptide (TPR) repeat protein
LLYDVLLHEIGHLQIVRPHASSLRRRFAMETMAERFAATWRKRLWSSPFAHADPAHNPPSVQELNDEDPELTDLALRARLRPNDVALQHRLSGAFIKRGRAEEARAILEARLAAAPNDPWARLYLGSWHYDFGSLEIAIEYFSQGARMMPDAPAVSFWAIAEAYEAMGDDESAEAYYKRAVEVEPSDKMARAKLRRWRARVAECSCSTDAGEP